MTQELLLLPVYVYTLHARKRVPKRRIAEDFIVIYGGRGARVVIAIDKAIVTPVNLLPAACIFKCVVALHSLDYVTSQ